MFTQLNSIRTTFNPLPTRRILSKMTELMKIPCLTYRGNCVVDSPSVDTVGVGMIYVDERGMGPFFPLCKHSHYLKKKSSGCLIPSIPSDRLAAFLLKGDELIY